MKNFRVFKIFLKKFFPFVPEKQAIHSIRSKNGFFLSI